MRQTYPAELKTPDVVPEFGGLHDLMQCCDEVKVRSRLEKWSEKPRYVGFKNLKNFKVQILVF